MALKFQHPSNILIAGPSQSGKTRFLIRVLKENLIEPSPSQVLWFYREWQPAYKELEGIMNGRGIETHFISGYSDEKFESLTNRNRRSVVVLDDLMTEVKDSMNLSELFTRGSHHRNATVVFLLQNFFQQGRAMRTVSLNAHYIVLFRNPRDQTQFSILARQLLGAGTRSAWLQGAYSDAVERPYGYFVIDNRPDSPSALRFRTNIFRGDNLIIYASANTIKGAEFKGDNFCDIEIPEDQHA